MTIKMLTPDFAVSPQITADEISAIAVEGFKSIICNRPDEEEEGQPQFEEVATAAKAAGIDIRYLPFTSGAMSEQDEEEFADLMAELPRPILAYCRSGARSSNLFLSYQAKV